MNSPSNIPTAFTYGGKTYIGLCEPELTLVSKHTERACERESTTFTYSLADGLTVELLLTHYFSHGATEWTLFFENKTDKNSEIIEDVRCELSFLGKYPTLRGILGDHTNRYSPYTIDLQNNLVEFSSDTGRATHINFPYFNLEHGDGGTLLAIGWAGTWSAEFSADADTTHCTLRSVNGIRTYLKPGERIRTALFVRLPYGERNESFATNLWRSWFITHNMPKANAEGDMLAPFSTNCFAYDTGLPNSDGSISERYTTWKPTMDKILSEGLDIDFRWFDAGWYVRPNGQSEEVDWWGSVGTWELDPVKWPGKSFLESTEYARAHGMKTLVWFEPERISDPESLAKNYGYNTDWAIRAEGNTSSSDVGNPLNPEDANKRILISNNIGDPECLKWTTERICKMLRENKVDMYREDNNCNVAKLWGYLDSVEGDGRVGITECKFISGHYKMWDDIIACTSSYGGCAFVDSCASGGGRNDLESMRRGVPLLRSDSDRTTTALRLSMTTAFSKWIPFSGASTKESVGEHDAGEQDSYVWRASYLPALNVFGRFTQDKDFNFDVIRFGIGEWKRFSRYMLSDFYTLTPWHREEDTTSFTAFAYFDPEMCEGALLAFRQESCVKDTLTVNLPFTNGDEYVLTDEDSGEKIHTKGKLSLHFDAPRTARLIWIKKNG
ncbi:MAG: alpha-galactosidase [Clostridia bacterium]|nr:alpha-galactosidase [Clostridia bacterium]